jgi:putative peptidoglycan lipid II flippase
MGAAMFKAFVPVLIGLGALQLSSLADTALATWPVWNGPTILGHEYPLDKRSGVILTAAQRLYQFPLGVFGIAVATAVFPALARSASRPEDFGAMIRRGIRLSLFIALPASVGLIVIRSDLVHALYGGGTGFSAEGVARSAAVLAGYAPAIWAYSLNHVLARAFFARSDTVTPMRVAMLLVVANFALNCLLMWPLKEAGLAWSTAITATMQTLILIVLCRRKLDVLVMDSTMFRAIVRMTLATGVMTLAAIGTQLALQQLIPGELWRPTAARLLLTMAVAGFAYLGGSWLLRVDELRWLIAIRQRQSP